MGPSHLPGHLVDLSLGWWGLLFYVIVHLGHLAFWRVARPKRDIRALFAWFMIPAAAPFALAVLWGEWPPIFSETRWLAPCLAYLALAVQYIAVYPAFQASSPTIQILDLIRRSGGAMAEGEILSRLARPSISSDRVADLKRSRFVADGERGLRLTGRGKALAWVFVAYRSALGLPAGAG